MELQKYQPYSGLFKHQPQNIQNNFKEKKNDIEIAKYQVVNCEHKLEKVNEEYEQLKGRSFQLRRGRNNRIFYKPMEKTIYDYDSSDNEIKPHTDMNNKNYIDL